MRASCTMTCSQYRRHLHGGYLPRLIIIYELAAADVYPRSAACPREGRHAAGERLLLHRRGQVLRHCADLGGYCVLCRWDPSRWWVYDGGPRYSVVEGNVIAQVRYRWRTKTRTELGQGACRACVACPCPGAFSLFRPRADPASPTRHRTRTSLRGAWGRAAGVAKCAHGHAMERCNLCVLAESGAHCSRSLASSAEEEGEGKTEELQSRCGVGVTVSVILGRRQVELRRRDEFRGLGSGMATDMSKVNVNCTVLCRPR